ncbi:AMP-binding domain protein [Pseudomonas sp. 25 R 14]|nr:AMP-binding domain protein [Pseudomonas sp. 25 R 14]
MHRLGVRSGKAVFFLFPNLPHTHFVIWGGEAAGVVNAINPLLEPEHIAELIRASNTSVLVTLAPFPGTDLWQKVATLRERLPELTTIVTVDLANLLLEPQRRMVKAQRPSMLKKDALAQHTSFYTQINTLTRMWRYVGAIGAATFTVDLEPFLLGAIEISVKGVAQLLGGIYEVLLEGAVATQFAEVQRPVLTMPFIVDFMIVLSLFEVGQNLLKGPAPVA